jgi:serine/threonine protein kinase
VPKSIKTVPESPSAETPESASDPGSEAQASLLAQHGSNGADPSVFSGSVPSDPFHPDPFVGRMVGNCRILEKINEGGSSFIYRALNVNFNLERVVKILKPAWADDQEYYDRFKQEAQLTARLDHPNILRVFDTGEIGRQFFIEMEHVDGKTLRAFLNENRRIREVDILRIGSQLAQALDYAHNVRIQTPEGEVLQGILHRDIKPENIMLTPGAGLKLMDFGAAKPLSLNHGTLQGTVVGTPHYMSPEQMNDEALDARSDFFSLGIVLYELCTGSRPFDSDNLPTLLLRIDACKYEPPSKLRPSLSPLTAEIIERLLSKNPGNRPASAKEIHESLLVALHTLQQWGAGARAKIPFSFKRHYPTLALGFSAVALALSLSLSVRFYPLLRNPGEIRKHFSALVQKGVEAERKGEHETALGLYELTPSPEKGGDADNYLLSRLHAARLYMDKKGQLTKARSLLEGLGRSYRDPAIDAYLGILYFKSALYLESKDRLEAALESNRQTVLRRSDSFNPEEFRSEALYHLACAWDGQATFVEPNPENRDQAMQAFRRFLDFSCAQESGRFCELARKRVEELKSAS